MALGLLLLLVLYCVLYRGKFRDWRIWSPVKQLIRQNLRTDCSHREPSKLCALVHTCRNAEHVCLKKQWLK